MGDSSAAMLREAANLAHRHGDIDQAVAIYEQIVLRFPDSAEAVDAVFYLSSLGMKTKRLPPRRANE